MLFIDEIHRMAPAIEEILYPAMEDYELDIVIGQGPSARSVKVPLQQFTLIGATTRAGLLTSPLRARFGIVHRLDFYDRSRPRGDRPPLGADPGRADRRGGRGRRSRGARAARRASPTGCCGACATTRRCAPTARITGDGRARRAEAARSGRARVRRSRSQAAADDHRKFGGGPVGVNSIAAAISEEKDAIEDIYEPFLIQVGFLDRTPAWPRGHVARVRATSGSLPLEGILACGKRCAAPRVPWRATIQSWPPTCRRSAHQRRSREAGRHQRRVDSAADRHPRASHRRARRGHVGSRRRKRPTRPSSAPVSRRMISTSSSSAPTTPDMLFPSTACLVQHKIGAHPHGATTCSPRARLHVRADDGQPDGRDRRAASTRWSSAPT